MEQRGWWSQRGRIIRAKYHPDRTEIRKYSVTNIKGEERKEGNNKELLIILISMIIKSGKTILIMMKMKGIPIEEKTKIQEYFQIQYKQQL